MVAQRDASGKFAKGHSGNPGGRPAGEFTITGLIDTAVGKDDWLFIIEKLKTMARHGNLKAMEMLMDRRWGKPGQPLTGPDGEGLTFIWQSHKPTE